MDASGTTSPLIYILGEAPGSEEDVQGEPFVGTSGRLLKEVLKQTFKDWIGLSGGSVEGVCRFNNAVRSRPHANADPDEVAVECCRPSIQADIANTKPLVVVTLGNVPLNWVMLPVYKASTPYKISSWRGRLFPAQIGGHAVWVAPTYHPAYVTRADKGTVHSSVSGTNEYRDVFVRDFTRIRQQLLSDGEKEIWPSAQVRQAIDEFVLLKGEVGDAERLESAIEYLSNVERFAFDIETASGETTNERKLRPYGHQARLLSISFSEGTQTFSVALDHAGRAWSDREIVWVRQKIVELFTNTPGVVKIAHNLAYELEWMLCLLGLPTLNDHNWHDTLAQAYVADSRTGVLSLDALCRIYFGVHLKGYEEVDVANLDREPIDRVLRYNGLDSYFTAFLHDRQMAHLTKHEMRAVADEQVRRIPPFVRAQAIGLPVSSEEVKRYDNYLTQRKIKSIEDIKAEPAVERYRQQFGMFNPGSDADVRRLLRDVLGRSEGERKGRTYSTDESVLNEIGLPVTQAILDYRQWTKLKNTYIDPFNESTGKFLWPDGRAHAAYKLAFVATRRTSSESPNIQNLPSRKHKYIRSCFVAPPDHYLVAVDYGQIEARVIAMISQDDYLVAALWNRYDIHREWAEKVAHIYPDILDRVSAADHEGQMKELRGEIKNKLVFPAFYGAQAYSISHNFKLPLGVTEELLDDFWHTFPGVANWQNDVKRFYAQNGYVELLTGFRRYGPLEGTKVINSPIQGTSSDLVVSAMTRCSQYAERHNDLELQPVINIHDDLSFFVHEQHLERKISQITDLMLQTEYDFVNVPLAVEITAGPDWYNQEDVAEISSDEWEFGHA